MAKLVLGGTIDVDEDSDESPTINISADGNRTIRRTVYLNDPADPPTGAIVDQAIAELRPVNSFGGQYPTGADFYVQSVSVSPKSSAKNENAFGVAVARTWKLDITYGAPNVMAPSGGGNPPDSIARALELLTIQEELGSSYKSIDGFNLYWFGEDVPIANGNLSSLVRRPIRNVTLTRNFYFPTEEFVQISENLAGKVNRSNFDDDHPIYPGVRGRSMRYDGHSRRFSLASDGSLQSSVILNLTIALGWRLTELWDSSAGEQKFKEAFRNPAGQVDGNGDPIPQAPVIEDEENIEFIKILTR